MSSMARLEFGRLRQAWKGEAADFTPLLAEQLDSLGSAIGVDLASIGKAEVLTAGDRRIDIVANSTDGELVIENQYGRADHDHLTRGLAYAVARRARGLVVVAEEHRDEFRAVAEYLNEMAENDAERGIAVWLVEAQAVRIGESAWAPLFTTVVRPNAFTSRIEQDKRDETRIGSLDEFYEQCSSEIVRKAAKQLVTRWEEAGHRYRFGPDHAVLMAAGPSVNGLRSVVAVYTDGRVLVPFGAYAGQNSGRGIESLTTDAFRAQADATFGFKGSERQARTVPGWLSGDRADVLFNFCQEVAEAYAVAANTALTV